MDDNEKQQAATATTDPEKQQATIAPDPEQVKQEAAAAIAPAPDVILPKCGACGDDPVKLFRLRYDWPDGVLAETIFCGNCRAIFGAQIVFVPKR